MKKAEIDADTTIVRGTMLEQGLSGVAKVKIEKGFCPPVQSAKSMKNVIKPESLSDEEKFDWSDISCTKMSRINEYGAAVLPKGYICSIGPSTMVEIREPGALVQNGLVKDIHRDGTIEVLVDGEFQPKIFPLKCVKGVDPKNSLALAYSFYSSRFKGTDWHWKIAKQVLSDYPDHEKANLLICSWLNEEGPSSVKESEQILRLVLKRNPSTANPDRLKALSLLADVMKQRGKPHDALRLCQEVLDADPEAGFSALLCMCGIYKSLGSLPDYERCRARLMSNMERDMLADRQSKRNAEAGGGASGQRRKRIRKQPTEPSAAGGCGSP
jgi:hypothetical protein